MKAITIEDTVKRIIWEVENRKVLSNLENIIEKDIYTYIKFGDLKDLDKRSIKRMKEEDKMLKQMKGW